MMIVIVEVEVLGWDDFDCRIMVLWWWSQSSNHHIVVFYYDNMTIFVTLLGWLWLLWLWGRMTKVGHSLGRTLAVMPFKVHYSSLALCLALSGVPDLSCCPPNSGGNSQSEFVIIISTVILWLKQPACHKSSPARQVHQSSLSWAVLMGEINQAEVLIGGRPDVEYRQLLIVPMLGDTPE